MEARSDGGNQWATSGMFRIDIWTFLLF